jgi:DNA-binding PadR family transcriptional regulator
MSVSYTILGVLMDAPAHGYSIRKHLEETFSKDLGLNDGQLYPALAKLESQGLIEKEVVEQRSSPTKHLYRVTEAGRVAFQRWLEGAEPDDARERVGFFWRDGFLQRCSYFARLDFEIVAKQVEGRLAETSRCAQRLEAALAELEAREDDPYRRMILEYGARLQRMRESWLEELLARARKPSRTKTTEVRAARAR